MRAVCIFEGKDWDGHSLRQRIDNPSPEEVIKVLDTNWGTLHPETNRQIMYHTKAIRIIERDEV